MYFTHVRSGNRRQRRSYLEETLGTVVADAKAFISEALNSPLPVPMRWAGLYSGTARIEHGGLVVSVVTTDNADVLEVRVALRSRHAKLWPNVSELHRPSEPWCHTTVYMPAAAPEDEDLIVIENAIAWAWNQLKGLRLT